MYLHDFVNTLTVMVLIIGQCIFTGGWLHKWRQPLYWVQVKETFKAEKVDCNLDSILCAYLSYRLDLRPLGCFDCLWAEVMHRNLELLFSLITMKPYKSRASGWQYIHLEVCAVLLLAALAAEGAVNPSFKKLLFVTKIDVIVKIVLGIDAVCVACTQALVEMLLVFDKFTD